MIVVHAFATSDTWLFGCGCALFCFCTLRSPVIRPATNTAAAVTKPMDEYMITDQVFDMFFLS